MIHLQEIAPEPGIYLLHDKEEHILYVGRANNLRVRLRQHEANYDIVKPWMCFFDEQFENLNLRIKEASDQEDGARFDKISRIIGWPLAMIDSMPAIDCVYGSVDAAHTIQCPVEELDRKESDYIASLRPPFSYQRNNDLPDSERRKHWPQDYVRSKALCKLLLHCSRELTLRMPEEP